MPAKCEVVGLWPRFYATIQLICHRSREHIFVISRESTTSTFFSVPSQGYELLASRAMTTHNNLFYVVSLWANNKNTMFSSYRMCERASKQWPCGILAKSKPVYIVLRWANDYCHSQEKQSIFYTFFTLYPKRRWHNRVQEHVYHRKDATTWRVLMLREAVVLPGCNNSDSTIARREDLTIKFFMLSIKGWQQ